ncbi:copper homeostasis protein CutC [Devosia sp.]|uniref:copper homeostasis protein CutC n=1 Tax=Devosia sp. TaxID=1871048 RepID=UPI003BACCAFC
MTARVIEICVADAASLSAAIVGGADRIELCSALEMGGLTPSPGLMRIAARAPIPVYAMVRPRSGDFVFGAGDFDVMRAEIDAVRAAGLAGVVLGASQVNGELDAEMLAHLVAHADGLGVALHRAIDLVPDITDAVNIAVELGFQRILTSGGAETALAGVAGIATALAAARGRIVIMAGSGITPAALGALLEQLPLTEVHGAAALPQPTEGADAVRLGFAAASRRVTDAETVAALKRILQR